MTNRIKRSNDELKADRPTANELKFIPKAPIYFMLENIRSVYNVGSIFRTADGFGASKIYLTGYTACPPREDLTKTALGSEKVVPWIQFEDSLEAIDDIIDKGITPIVVEQTIKSILASIASKIEFSQLRFWRISSCLRVISRASC